MIKLVLAAGLAAATLIPSIASAQSCQQQRDNHAASTVVGAGFGAVLGGIIAGPRDRTAGVVLGGVGGAIAGSTLSRPAYDCTHAYGFYDNAGHWHGTGADRADARGYYDRDGRWMDGAPTGSYNSGGQWMASDAPPPPQAGNDRHRDPAPSAGYYDNNGQWHESGGAPNGPDYGANSAYRDQPGRMDQGAGIHAREDALDQQIRSAMNDGGISHYQARAALRTLQSIRNDEAAMRRYHGQLGDNDRAHVMGRLDRLSADVERGQR
jgi:hypothetical protein